MAINQLTSFSERFSTTQTPPRELSRTMSAQLRAFISPMWMMHVLPASLGELFHSWRAPLYTSASTCDPGGEGGGEGFGEGGGGKGVRLGAHLEGRECRGFAVRRETHEGGRVIDKEGGPDTAVRCEHIPAIEGHHRTITRPSRGTQEGRKRHARDSQVARKWHASGTH